jgi:hypothetical protein
MFDRDTRAGSDELQFDRVITESTASPLPSTLAVICTACQTPIETEYFDVNGSILCSRCRRVAESAADTPRGIVPLMTAGVYGLGAGIFGAAVYYAVIAIAHLEIGIVAILIGYMVGYAVRTGARGRGGFRFQVLAVALTYASIALAYAPIAFKQAIDADRTASNARAATTTSNGNTTAATDSGGTAPDSGGTAPDSGRAATNRPSGRRVLRSVVFLAALIAALPVLVVFGSLPSGLISAFIIFIGMRQAWKMTGAPWLQILGPYRVGASPAAIPA